MVYGSGTIVRLNPASRHHTKRSGGVAEYVYGRLTRVFGVMGLRLGRVVFFFFNDTATTELYTLSLHDALPISWGDHLSPIMYLFVPAFWLAPGDRKSTRLNSSHVKISYAHLCLKKKKQNQ